MLWKDRCARWPRSAPRQPFGAQARATRLAIAHSLGLWGGPPGPRGSPGPAPDQHRRLESDQAGRETVRGPEGPAHKILPLHELDVRLPDDSEVRRNAITLLGHINLSRHARGDVLPCS